MSEPLVLSGDVDADGTIRLDLPRTRVQALCRARFATERVDVEIRRRKSKRTDRQNRALHAAWKGWADFLGYDVDELKREVLGQVFGTVEITSPITGRVEHVPVEPHTSKLDTAQFAELMDRAVEIAARTGYVLLLPDEYLAA